MKTNANTIRTKQKIRFKLLLGTFQISTTRVPGEVQRSRLKYSKLNYDRFSVKLGVIIEGIHTYIFGKTTLRSRTKLILKKKYVKRIKLICGVLEPGSVLKPGTSLVRSQI